MHPYTVIDVNAGIRLVALRDDQGNYHAAHCTSSLPDIGEALGDFLPERGYTLLIQSDGGLSRVTLRAAARDQSWVFGVLHPTDPCGAVSRQAVR